MEKLIRVVDKTRGIIQVTTADERWYIRQAQDKITGLPTHEFVPSVTWITDHYPKGIGFYKWLANTGWDESQAIKEAAGGRGSKVHQAIGDLLDGKEVLIDAAYTNTALDAMEPLTLEEYAAVLSFAAWHRLEKPEFIEREMVIWNDQENYAGTIDFLCKIKGELWLIDFKTSQAVYPSHEMQVSAYKQAVPGWANARLGILQLGYKRNRIGYRFTEVSECFDLFLAAKKIWAKETAGQVPLQKDYPVSIVLDKHRPEPTAALVSLPKESTPE